MNARPAPMSLPWLLVLHLLPGAIATLIFVLLAAPIEATGYPPLAAFLIAIAIGIVPFEIGVVVLAVGVPRAPVGSWQRSLIGDRCGGAIG